MQAFVRIADFGSQRDLPTEKPLLEYFRPIEGFHVPYLVVAP